MKSTQSIMSYVPGRRHSPLGFLLDTMSTSSLGWMTQAALSVHLWREDLFHKQEINLFNLLNRWTCSLCSVLLLLVFFIFITRSEVNNSRTSLVLFFVPFTPDLLSVPYWTAFSFLLYWCQSLSQIQAFLCQRIPERDTAAGFLTGSENCMLRKCLLGISGPLA